MSKESTMVDLQFLLTVALLLPTSGDARADADTGAAALAAEASVGSSAAQHQRVVIPVEGMGCESCAERLQSKLAQLDGVTKATVDFAEREARVTFDPSKIKPSRIVAEIDKVFQAGKPKTDGAP